MPTNRYISTKDAVHLIGLSTQEIYDLIHSGALPARKAPKSGWRILPQDLAALGLIKNETDSVVEASQTEDSVSYVADEEHQNFSVFIDSAGREETLRLCDFFMSLVERGVHIQVVCMKPFGFYLYTKKNYPQLFENPLFELRYNGHNHMKVFVFDNECAYIGSANITSAAIGKRASGNRNHEAGMLLCGPSMMQAPLNHFERVWNDPNILKSTWKRFATKAKELEKEMD